MARMPIDQLLEVCRQEFWKALRALAAAYELMRAADECALRALSVFFQDR
jgi:hypothetical protein